MGPEDQLLGDVAQEGLCHRGQSRVLLRLRQTALLQDLPLQDRRQLRQVLQVCDVDHQRPRLFVEQAAQALQVAVQKIAPHASSTRHIRMAHSNHLLT